jgi:hypothetical protein
MRVTLVGCEYSGTTTLAFRIREWIHSEIGGHVNLVHDHFKIPYTVTHPDEYAPVPSDFTIEEQEQFLALSPRIKDNIMRHNVVYHTAALPGMADKVIVGLHIEEAVYGELYFGYTDRRGFMDGIENKILGTAPDTVLCLVTASSNIIRSRMSANLHPNGVLKEPDIELVLTRFQEEFERSRLTHKISLDTSDATIDESVAEFVRLVEPHLTDHDRARMASTPKQRE